MTTSFRGLHNWFAPPIFPEEEEKTRQAYLINLVIKAGLSFLAASFVILPWVSTKQSFTRFLFAVISIFCVLLLSKVILNRRWVRGAGYFLAANLWLVFAFITLGGPEGLTGTPFWGAVTLTPLIAGFVSGTRASVIITVLNWILGGALVWAEINGHIPLGAPYDPPVQYLSSMVMFSSFPLLVYLWRRNFDEAIEQVRVVEVAQRETAVYQSQNEELEEAVKDRTSDLENALAREQYLAEQLKQALAAETELGELQSRIITVVSHEFRTPLAVIHSSAELLQHYYDKLSKERKAAAHQRIGEAIFYLNDLLKGVNLVDQAQRARLQPIYQTYPFNEMCQKLTEQLLLEINQPQRVIFEYVPIIETPLQTDLTLLAQIIGNLVSNALKYSEKTSPVHVHLWLDGPQLVIEVQDQGIGIPLHEQTKVFELFYRASNIDERRGLGLGLFIVQAITKQMQGRAVLLSQEKGQGSTFQIYLPLLPVPEMMAV